jgi:hypothetical protein
MQQNNGPAVFILILKNKIFIVKFLEVWHFVSFRFTIFAVIFCRYFLLSGCYNLIIATEIFVYLYIYYLKFLYIYIYQKTCLSLMFSGILRFSAAKCCRSNVVPILDRRFWCMALIV